MKTQELDSWLSHTDVAETRRSTTTGGTVERAAAISNLARRESAVVFIESTLGPVEALLSPVAGASTLTTAATILTAPEAEDIIDHVLAFEDNRPPLLGVSPGPETLAPIVDFRSTYDVLRPDVLSLHQQLELGGVLVLAGIEGYHQRLIRLSEALANIGIPGVQCDLLVLGPASTVELGPRLGLDWVLTSIGEAVALRKPKEGREEQLELSAGTAILLSSTGGPDRWLVHSDRPSILLRTTLPRPTTGQLAAAIASSRAQLHPLMRSDLPADLAAPASSYGGSPFDKPSGFAELVATLIDETSIETSVHRQRTVGSPGAPFGHPLPEVLAGLAGAPVALRVRAAQGLSVKAADPEQLVLGSHQLLASADLQIAIATIADGKWHSPSELAALGLDVEEARRLVATLIAAGHLEVGSATVGDGHA